MYCKVHSKTVPNCSLFPLFRGVGASRCLVRAVPVEVPGVCHEPESLDVCASIFLCPQSSHEPFGFICSSLEFPPWALLASLPLFRCNFLFLFPSAGLCFPFAVPCVRAVFLSFSSFFLSRARVYFIRCCVLDLCQLFAFFRFFLNFFPEKFFYSAGKL